MRARIRSALAIVLVALTAASCRRCGSSGAPTTCHPRVSTAAEPVSTDVRSVTIYWDTSRSMAAYLQQDSALGALWRSLDTKWTRRASQTIDTVEHIGVGATIRLLARLGTTPVATDDWTDLPRMAEQIGQHLGSTDDAAAVVVSDMLVDTPPLPVDTKLCGDVSVPAGRGDVPALVGKCIAAGLGSTAPADTVITSVTLADPLGPRAPARPLFVTIFARNAKFSAQFASVLTSELSGFGASSLAIVKAAANVPCDHVADCRYRPHASLVSHEGCSFTVTHESKKEQFPMTCIIDSPDDSFEAGLLALQSQSMTHNGADGPAVERHGMRVMDLKLPITPGDHDLGAKVRWSVRDDAGARIDQWLSGRYDNVADYRDLYRTMASILARQLAPPACRQTATVELRSRLGEARFRFSNCRSRTVVRSGPTRWRCNATSRRARPKTTSSSTAPAKSVDRQWTPRRLRPAQAPPARESRRNRSSPRASGGSTSFWCGRSSRLVG